MKFNLNKKQFLISLLIDIILIGLIVTLFFIKDKFESVNKIFVILVIMLIFISFFVSYIIKYRLKN